MKIAILNHCPIFIPTVPIKLFKILKQFSLWHSKQMGIEDTTKQLIHKIGYNVFCTITNR